jgi:hypothetical protein
MNFCPKAKKTSLGAQYLYFLVTDLCGLEYDPVGGVEFTRVLDKHPRRL